MRHTRLPFRVGCTLSSVLAALAVLAAPADAQPRVVQGKHARVEIVAAAEAPDQSGTLWLGVRFAMDPGWHIYWRNPGDSGGPPQALWQWPSSVTVDDFLWPVPERIPLGPLVNYGYKGEVVLPVALKIGPAARGTRMSGSVDLRWLICKDICIPDRATLGITFPLTSSDQGSLGGWRQQIEHARAAVPRPAPRAWSATAEASRDRIVVSIGADRAVAGATFFPIDEGVINESAPQRIDARGRDLRVTLERSPYVVNLPSHLRGVVVLPSGEAFEVSARVTEAPKGESPVRE